MNRREEENLILRALNVKQGEFVSLSSKDFDGRLSKSMFPQICQRLEKQELIEIEALQEDKEDVVARARIRKRGIRRLRGGMTIDEKADLYLETLADYVDSGKADAFNVGVFDGALTKNEFYELTRYLDEKNYVNAQLTERRSLVSIEITIEGRRKLDGVEDKGGTVTYYDQRNYGDNTVYGPATIGDYNNQEVHYHFEQVAKIIKQSAATQKDKKSAWQHLKEIAEIVGLSIQAGAAGADLFGK